MQQLSLAFLVRALTGLASHKLPTQTQLSKIITAILDSPIFSISTSSTSDHPSQQQPELLSSIAEFLVLFKNLTNTKNQENQIQRLLNALVLNKLQQPQLRLPSLPPSTSPTVFFTKLLLISTEIPQDVNEIIRQAIELLTELFQSTERTTTQEDEQAVDRLVSKLIKLIVHLRTNISHLLREEIESIRKTLAEDLQGFELNDEFREILGLLGECIDGFCTRHDDDRAPSYWHSLTTPCNQLVELFTEHKDQLLVPLKKVCKSTRICLRKHNIYLHLRAFTNLDLSVL
jgi:hypothetical protein